jgi:hypothetical protein
MPVTQVSFVALRHGFITTLIVLLDVGRLITLAVRSRRTLAAENLFLRKQLALFQERRAKPRKADDSTRWIMATLSRMFEARDALWTVNRIPSSGGIAKDFGSFGIGNRSRWEGRAYPRTFDS